MDLTLNMKQTQTLSPQMVQSMKLLQMDAMALREYLEEQLQENPVLELEPPAQPAGAEQESGPEQLLQKLEWLHATDVQNSWYNREDAQDRRFPEPADAASGEESLYEHLHGQISFRTLPPVLATAVETVLKSLNGAGRLDDPLEVLAAHGGVPVPVLEEALRLVQGLEPAGVAARDLSECLCIQLIRRGETGLPLVIAQNYLEDMGQDHYHYIARAVGASREEVQAACRLIRRLDPRPGAAFAPGGHPGYVIPDLAVVTEAGRTEVVLNDSFLPTIRLSSYYYRLMKQTGDAEVRDYLSGKIHQAKWLVQNIEQRRSTLLSCARCMVARQGDFFRRGEGHLRPMSLADVAGELEIHASTVSRAIRGKYLQCAFGVYPLKFFFSGALPGEHGGEEVSAERARSLLRALIDGENRKSPLSDQKLSQLLAAQGVEISRRTVAKYREELGIPSTFGRKEL